VGGGWVCGRRGAGRGLRAERGVRWGCGRGEAAAGTAAGGRGAGTVCKEAEGASPPS